MQARFDAGKELVLSASLREFFGGKFNHRLQLLIESKQGEEEVKTENKLSVTTIPATAWPVAGEWLLSCVPPHVGFQVGGLGIQFPAS